MSTGTNTPRLLAAAKEFNIGKDTLVDFLKGKGFEIDASKPTAKLSEEMYTALQNQFAQAKDAKKKSESIALPKGSLIDNLQKTQEQLDITAKDKKEEKTAEPKKAEQPKAVEKQEPQPEPKVEGLSYKRSA